MGKIQILDDHVANQIAAGEVVERPASVVKELCENAIDAGSTIIDVAVDEGGLQLIRVTDNGSGMAADDCELAFFRHATSKIATGKDLFHIRTLGFRGEALASISAVAKVRLVTADTEDGLGREVVVEGGTLRSAREIAASRGTDIQVKELFYNTPARLKYMKTIQTELSHMTDFMYRLALARPDIAFTLRHNGNLLLQTSGDGDVRQTIAAVYGTSAAKMVVAVSAEDADYRLAGYVSKPELNRANRSAISIFVNGRYIRNYAVAAALLEAYHTLLPLHRFPLAVLHVQMDPSLVDVNVHPSKLEVRFSKEQELMRLVQLAVREELQRHVLIPQGQGGSATRGEAVVQEQMTLYRPAAAQPSPLSPSRSVKSPRTDEPTTGTELPPLPPEPPSAPYEREAAASWQAAEQRQPTAVEAAAVRAVLPAPADRSSGQADGQKETESGFPRLYPIGQLHGTYIVAQNEAGLFLIDQHAAHERINYEFYYRKFGQPEPASQHMLLPVTIELTSSDAALLTERLPVLAQIGVTLEPFGGNTFVVRGYPSWFPPGETAALIEEMTEWLLSEKKSVDLHKFRDKAAIMCSCKASIKANHSLGTVEMEALLDRLGACANPYTCPHGRPIVVSFSVYELEKMFKRVM